MLTLPDFLLPLEQEVVKICAESEELYREELFVQLASSNLLKREFNGYGFFTHFSVPPTSPVLPYESFRFHASAKVGGELCGFMLWITSGRVDFLEGFPLGGDEWPESQTLSDLKLT